MERAEYSDENCSVARTLEIVGERWSLLILREAFLGVRRFDQLQANLGIARNILADRLQRLVGAGILERERYHERPQRFEYRLTRMGLDLYPALVSIMQWGDRYLADKAGPPVKLEHLACGKETEPLFVCSECGDPIEARGVRAKIGPGALRRTA
jgi:DNA-binding HxlR family transcriptional regulator